MDYNSCFTNLDEFTTVDDITDVDKTNCCDDINNYLA